MSTRQELEQRLAALNQERRRLRQLSDLNGPLQREIEALRARVPTITDPLERQRAQARLDQAQDEITRARVRLADIFDELQAVDKQIFDIDRGIEGAASRAQGTGADSAGATVAQGQQANADRADTQSPAPPAQSATATGAVAATPATAAPSNATPNQTPAPTAPPPPSTLPPGQVSATPGPTATVPAARGSQSPGTALQSGLVNLQTADIDDTLVSYVYQAVRVVSNFRQGRFTQDIEGAQIFFELPKKPQPPAQPTAPANAAPGLGTAPAQPQTTVAQTATTPGALGTTNGVSFRGQVGAEFGAYFDDGTTGEPGERLNRRTPGPNDTPIPGGSTFSNEGFGDPTAEQISAPAPLQSEPPSSGTRDVAPARSRAQTAALQAQLQAARQQVTEYDRLANAMRQKIDRGGGNIVTQAGDRRLLAQYTARAEQAQLTAARLQAEINNQVGPATNTTRIAPQQGARES